MQSDTREMKINQCVHSFQEDPKESTNPALLSTTRASNEGLEMTRYT
jgi:hypothetical protein